jgi:thiol-disulfide isomerase/thioredoxin
MTFTVLFGLSVLTLSSCVDAPQKTSTAEAVDQSASTAHTSSDASSQDSTNEHAEHGQHGDGQHGDGQHDKKSGHANHNEHAKPNQFAHKDHNAHGQGQHGQTKAGHSRTGHGGHSHGGASNSSPKIAIGEKVPDFKVTLNGKVWTLSELQKNSQITSDGTLVLTFWCSFCHSCRHVELSLDKLAQESGKAGVIAIDASYGETQDKITAFAKKRGLTLPIAISSDGSAADIFGVKKTTTTVIIDKTGTLRYFGQFGDRRHSYAKDALNAILAGKEVPVERTRPKG